MSRRHYHIIILGEGLGARIAGILLARRGCRVLSFPEKDPWGRAAWFHSSALLERILETLGGRSCYAPPVPLQVITSDSRLEFHGQSPLEEEFRREFPEDHESLVQTLQRLAETGEQLEKLLWSGAYLPLFGPLSRSSFSWRTFRRGLDRPLGRSLLSQFGPAGAPAMAAADSLFTGLALTPAHRMTFAEGALLWSAASRPRGISVAGLDTLLRHRFEQFHGEETAPGSISRLRLDGPGPPVAVMKDGKEFSADHLIIGSCEFFPSLPEKLQKALPPRAVPDLFTAGIPEIRISPLLAPRVILAGKPPMRFSLTARDNLIQCETEIQRFADTPPVESESVRERLSPLFPFAEITPLRQGAGIPAAANSSRPQSAFPGAAAPMRLGRNLFLCHAPTLFPNLGATGEALAGVSLCNYLAGRMKLRP